MSLGLVLSQKLHMQTPVMPLCELTDKSADIKMTQRNQDFNLFKLIRTDIIYTLPYL